MGSLLLKKNWGYDPARSYDSFARILAPIEEVDHRSVILKMENIHWRRIWGI